MNRIVLVAVASVIATSVFVVGLADQPSVTLRMGDGSGSITAEWSEGPDEVAMLRVTGVGPQAPRSTSSRSQQSPLWRKSVPVTHVDQAKVVGVQPGSYTVELLDENKNVLALDWVEMAREDHVDAFVDGAMPSEVLTGRVICERSGEPIAGAIVNVKFEPSVVTDASGEFSLVTRVREQHVLEVAGSDTDSLTRNVVGGGSVGDISHHLGDAARIADVDPQ